MKAQGKRIYLSGPMSGLSDLNRPAFLRAEADLVEAGAADVFNPALAPYPADSRAEAMANDLHALTACDGAGPLWDLVVQLPGWRASAGAVLESQVAAALGIPCAEAEEVL